MPISLSRRGLLIGALAAPAVVRAASIMPVRNPGLVKGIWLGNNTFEPLATEDYRSLCHEPVWLHKSHPAVQEAQRCRSFTEEMGESIQPPVDIAAITANIISRRTAWLNNSENQKRIINAGAPAGGLARSLTSRIAVI
jgi:hypothetical protein